MTNTPVECLRGGHTWRPRTMAATPTVCPTCRSPYWNRPRGAETADDRLPVKFSRLRVRAYITPQGHEVKNKKGGA